MSTITPGSPEARPLVSSMFEVDLGKFKIENVTSVSGLAIDVQDVEAKSVSGGEFREEYQPGTVSYGELTIKRVFRGDRTMYDWYDKVAKGEDVRDDGSIVMYDLAKKEVDRWNFLAGWPSKWSISDLDTGSDDPISEEITLQIEFLERVK